MSTDCLTHFFCSRLCLSSQMPPGHRSVSVGNGRASSPLNPFPSRRSIATVPEHQIQRIEASDWPLERSSTAVLVAPQVVASEERKPSLFSQQIRRDSRILSDVCRLRYRVSENRLFRPFERKDPSCTAQHCYGRLVRAILVAIIVVPI